MTTRVPTIFISYAWEDDVKVWVREFATRLRRQGGIDVHIDQWHVAPGDPLPAFMESAVRTNDFVLLVCTPKYKAKADARQGGVGYEGDIITAEVFTKANHRKFIPILRKDDWSAAAPSFVLGNLYLDFRGDPYKEAAYEDLLLALRGQLEGPPTLGPAPRELPRENAAPRPPHTQQLESEELARGRHSESQPVRSAAASRRRPLLWSVFGLTVVGAFAVITWRAVRAPDFVVIDWGPGSITCRTSDPQLILGDCKQLKDLEWLHVELETLRKKRVGWLPRLPTTFTLRPGDNEKTGVKNYYLSIYDSTTTQRVGNIWIREGKMLITDLATGGKFWLAYDENERWSAGSDPKYLTLAP
jgi:hypothetical protein